MTIARVEHIFIYPFKALDGLSVNSATVLANGALKDDRRFALRDSEGRFINGKRVELVHQLRAEIDLKHDTVALWSVSHSREMFSFYDPQLLTFLSDFFHMTVTIEEKKDGGFPDDTYAPGITLASTPSVQELCRWFPTISVEAMRRRFRHNIEISSAYPFWEDELLPNEDRDGSFSIGAIEFEATGACSRCVVPSRDPETGTLYPRFQREFTYQREALLSARVNRTYFPHTYKFSINTRARGRDEAIISLGDVVKKGV